MKLRIPVGGTFHAKLTTLVKWIGYIAYFGLFGYTVVLDIQKYVSANRIQSDMTVVDAPLTLDDIVEESGSKGRTYDVYHYHYTFEVNGQSHTGNMAVAERNLDKVISGDTIQVGYSNKNPAEFERLDKMNDFDSIWKVVKHLLIVAVVAAITVWIVCAYILFGLFINKDEKEEDEEDEAGEGVGKGATAQ